MDVQIKKRLGRNVRQKREAIGLTKEKLANYSDLSVTAVDNVECGLSFSRLDTFCKICRGLGCTPEELIPAEMYKETE